MESKTKNKKNSLRKHKNFIIVMSILILLSIIVAVYTFKPAITLKTLDNTLVWQYNKDIKNNLFVVVRDDKAIQTLTMSKYKDVSIKDTASPDKIKNVIITNNSNGVNLKWDTPTDNGQENTYYIKLINNKGETKLKSNKVKLKVPSGIKEYSIEINNQIFKVKDTTLNIVTAKLKEGTYPVKISAIDNAGNIGEAYTFEVSTFKPYITDNVITIKNNDGYSFTASLNNESIPVNDNRIDTSSLKDTTAPPILKNINTEINNNLLYISWDKPNDVGTSYTLQLQGKNDKESIVYGTGNIKSKASGIKGYYYSINNISNYKLNNDDTFIDKAYVDKINIIEGENYIHVASVDNNDNISATYTKKVNFVMNQSNGTIYIDNDNDAFSHTSNEIKIN